MVFDARGTQQLAALGLAGWRHGVVDELGVGDVACLGSLEAAGPARPRTGAPTRVGLSRFELVDVVRQWIGVATSTLLSA